jgi:hypothetical protein
MVKRFIQLLVLQMIALLTFAACGEDSKEALPFLEVSQTSVQAQPAGGELVIPFKASRKVTVTVAEAWCSYRVQHRAGLADDGTLTLNIEQNNTKDERIAKVNLSAEDCPDVVMEVSQKSALKGLLSLKLPKSLNQMKEDVEFVYDVTEGVYKAMCLKWIAKSEPEMLIPEFEATGKVFVGSQEVVSGKTAISFADDFVITVKADDGTSLDYNVVLNCPQINCELPVLHFRPDKLINSKDNYVDTYIELYDKTPDSSGEGWWDSAEKGKIEMRGRGNSTWVLPKKPFRMKFSEKFSPIGLNHAKEKSWTLLAQDMDKSLLRTHLAFEYSRALFDPQEGYHDSKAILFTPASQYINVYLTGDYYDSSTGKTRYMDGEYLGLYQMSDQLERATGRVAVEKLEEADGDNPDKITGGYLIEADLHEGNHPTAMKKIRFSYKYPKDDDFHQSQYDYISDFLNKAEQALYGPDFKDPQKGWRKYFDEKTLADFVIIKEFVGDMDGYTSIYAYKRRGHDKLFFGPIWDCDKGWDNDRRVPHSQHHPLTSLMIHAGFWMPSNVQDDWFQHLWTDETFRAFVAKRWADKKEELKALTDRVLREAPADMAKAIEANFTVWPFYYQYSSEAKMPAQTYELEIQRIRDISAAREALLDNLFNR